MRASTVCLFALTLALARANIIELLADVQAPPDEIAVLTATNSTKLLDSSEPEPLLTSIQSLAKKRLAAGMSPYGSEAVASHHAFGAKGVGGVIADLYALLNSLSVVTADVRVTCGFHMFYEDTAPAPFTTPLLACGSVISGVPVFRFYSYVLGARPSVDMGGVNISTSFTDLLGAASTIHRVALCPPSGGNGINGSTTYVYLTCASHQGSACLGHAPLNHVSGNILSPFANVGQVHNFWHAIAVSQQLPYAVTPSSTGYARGLLLQFPPGMAIRSGWFANVQALATLDGETFNSFSFRGACADSVCSLSAAEYASPSSDSCLATTLHQPSN